MPGDPGVAPIRYLFRAVLPEEEADILAEKILRIPIGLEVKYFTNTIEEAEEYARMAAKAFREGPYRIIRAPAQTLAVFPATINVDRGIIVLVLGGDDLAKLGPPELLHVVA